MRALIFAFVLLVGGDARADDAAKPQAPPDRKSLDLLGSYVVGKTTEAEFLAANWTFESAVQHRVGFIDVQWDQSGTSPIHTYSMGTCTGRTTDSAEMADQSVRRAMSASDPPPRWNLLLCSGTSATQVRYLQFRGGVLSKSEQP